MPVFPEAVRRQMSSIALKSIGWSLNVMAQISPPYAGEQALKLFTRPRSRKSNTHHPEVLDSSERIRFFIEELDLVITGFRWPGTGPTVFLAHGWESNTSRWLPLIRALRAMNYQIIGVDAPAHGFSEGSAFNVPMYTRVLQRIFENYPPDIFIGHSAGGMAGVYHLTLEKQPAFQQLILLAVPYELEDLMDTFRRLVGMNDRVFIELKAAFEAHFGFPMSAFSIQQFVKEVQVPGIIIHDKDDTIAPYAGGVAIHRNWMGSKLYTTDGLGHSLPGDQVVDTVVNYLTRMIHGKP